MVNSAPRCDGALKPVNLLVNIRSKLGEAFESIGKRCVCGKPVQTPGDGALRMDFRSLLPGAIREFVGCARTRRIAKLRSAISSTGVAVRVRGTANSLMLCRSGRAGRGRPLGGLGCRGIFRLTLRKQNVADSRVRTKVSCRISLWPGLQV